MLMALALMLVALPAHAMRYCCTATDTYTSYVDTGDGVIPITVTQDLSWCGPADNIPSAAALALTAWAQDGAFPVPTDVYDPVTGESTCGAEMLVEKAPDDFQWWECIGQGLKLIPPGVWELIWTGPMDPSAGVGAAMTKAEQEWEWYGWYVFPAMTLCWQIPPPWITMP